MPSIKTLIKQARYKDALDALEKLVPKHLENDIILLYSRATNLENQINGGVISSENAGIEMARIRAAILAIYDAAGIQELPDEEPKSQPDTKSDLSSTDRDTSDWSNEPIPDIEPLEEKLTVPKGEGDITTILFMTANPTDQQHLAVNRESNRVLKEAQGKALNVIVCPDIDRNSMIDMVAFKTPQIVHFSGHGQDGSLSMIDPNTGKTARIENEDLVDIFTLFKEAGVKCVVFCSCWSFSQAKAISALGLPVVGMLKKVADEHAIQFSQELYYLLVSNHSLQMIFKLAKAKIPEASRKIPSLWYNGKRIA